MKSEVNSSKRSLSPGKDKVAKKRVGHENEVMNKTCSLKFPLLILKQERPDDKEAADNKRRKESPDMPKEAESKVL